MIRLRAIILFLVLTVLLPNASVALEIEYVGALRDGLLAPTSVVADNDQIAVLEPYSRRLTLLTPEGRLTRRIDVDGDAMGLARLTETLYLFCDRTKQSIIAVDVSTGRQVEFFKDVNGDSDPVDIIVDDQFVYVLDASRAEVIIVADGGQVVDRVALPRESAGEKVFPASFTYEPNLREFFVASQVSSHIYAIDRQGTAVTSFGSFGGCDGCITRTGEIACDDSGHIYVTDRYQGRVVVFTTEGEFVTNIEPDALGAPRMAVPVGITVDDSGLLYVASAEGRSVEIYHTAGRDESQTPLIAAPVYPIDYDTVDVAGLRLIASAEAPWAAVEGANVDFQLFTDDDLEYPIAEGLGIPASREQGEDTVSVVLTAEWRPTADLAEGIVLGWRVRVHAAGQAGEWSSIQRFVTGMGQFDYHLAQNYPNPFNPSTNVVFTLQKSTAATVGIYNLLGQEVWSQTWDDLPAGPHVVTWLGKDRQGNQAASGVYFYRLTAGDFTQTRKMVLLR